MYLNAFDNSLQARKKISAWFSYYNRTRPHSTHNGQI
ncbi:MAG: integrase core domain-containing protein [Candidatus Omnitrophica bacterium]|nr:integrase core domain-containing protein [Candidatus Omnitrophota bacterium]